MEMSNPWLLVSAVLILFVIYWYMSKPRNLPPGPLGIPILGSLLSTEKAICLSFTKLGEKFGGLFHIYLGSQLTIVLNNYDVIKEALIKQGDIFAGRPVQPLKSVKGFFNGVGLTDDEYWKQHRKFLMHNLKDNGMGKLSMEPKLLDEIQYFLKEIRKQDGKPVKLVNLLAFSMANNIHLLVTGKRFAYDDPLLKSAIDSMEGFNALNLVIRVALFFPWAKPIIEVIFKNSINKGRLINVAIHQLIEQAISGSKSEFRNDQSSNYMQSFLKEKLKRLKLNRNENIFTDKSLVDNTKDLLMAGTDTTSRTLAWAAIYMVAYPDVQRKIQKEIDQTIGRNREPTYNDRLQTPYTVATIYEVHRMASLLPLALPHRITKSTVLLGYSLPKNSLVLPNIWAVHRDPKLWGDPDNFRPERFINSEGECVKPDYLIPFSIGKRVCAGEPLARMELYLYLASLLQNFDISLPGGKKKSIKYYPVMIHLPKEDLVCLTQRN